MATKKRSPYGDVTALAAQARAKQTATPATLERREYLSTAIHLPKDLWVLLRNAAFRRAMKRGGRPSVSALLVDLIERHRAELEKEASGE